MHLRMSHDDCPMYSVSLMHMPNRLEQRVVTTIRTVLAPATGIKMRSKGQAKKLDARKRSSGLDCIVKSSSYID